MSLYIIWFKSYLESNGVPVLFVLFQSYIQSIQHKLSTAVRKKVVTRRETLPPTEIDPSMASLTQSPET